MCKYLSAHEKRNIINIASRRGGFGAEEFEDVGKVFTNIYYGTLTWAEVQITKGTRVSDKIGLTEDLTTFVEETFDYYFY